MGAGDRAGDLSGQVTYLLPFHLEPDFLEGGLSRHVEDAIVGIWAGLSSRSKR